jgi:predicted MFS family arabinose efflux permease
LGGFYLSLGPTVVGELEHSSNLLWGGISIALLMGLGAVFSTATGSQPARTLMTAGCTALILGTSVAVVSIATRTGWLLLLGTGIAGVGFGPAFSGAYTSVVSSATEQDRAALIAAIYLLSYAALGAPAVAAGVAANHYGLRATALVYAAAVAALAGVVLLSLLGARRREPGRPPPAQGHVPPPPGPCTVPGCLPAEIQPVASSDTVDGKSTGRT